MDTSDRPAVPPFSLKNFLGRLPSPPIFCSSEKVIPRTSCLKANFGRLTSFCFEALSRGLCPTIFGPGDCVHCCPLRSTGPLSLLLSWFSSSAPVSSGLGGFLCPYRFVRTSWICELVCFTTFGKFS